MIWDLSHDFRAISERHQVAGPGVAGPPGLPSSPSQGIGMDDGGGLMLVPWEKTWEDDRFNQDDDLMGFYCGLMGFKGI